MTKKAFGLRSRNVEVEETSNPGAITISAGRPREKEWRGRGGGDSSFADSFHSQPTPSLQSVLSDP